MTEEAKQAHLARVYAAWCNSSASESTDYNDFLEELLTTEQAAALAVAAEEHAATNPASTGYCRWKGHKVYPPHDELFGVDGSDVCAAHYDEIEARYGSSK